MGGIAELVNNSTTDPRGFTALIGVIGVMATAMNFLLIEAFKPINVSPHLRANLMIAVFFVLIRLLVASTTAVPIGIDWNSVIFFGYLVFSLILYGLGCIHAIEDNRRMLRDRANRHKR